MAFERRLNVGWHLTDGRAEPFPIGRGMLIADALKAAGLPSEGALDRPWQYIASFETPLEADERVWLRFEQIWGSAAVVVNGQQAGEVTTGEAVVDVTALLAPEDNQLTLSFPPSPQAKWLGFCGDVFLITGNDLALDRLTARGSIVNLTLRVDKPGNYDFQYTANADGALILRQSTREALEPGEVRLTHTLNVKTPFPTLLRVRLNIVRQGVGCAQADFILPGGEGDTPPRRALAYHGAPVSAEAIQAMAEIGAQAVFAPDDPPRRVETPLYGSLTRLDRADVFAPSAACGQLCAFRQASHILRHALTCRQRGRLAVFSWNGTSTGIVTEDGTPRMAYHALKLAWQPRCAWVDVPESVAPGQDFLVDVWVSTGSGDEETLRLEYSAYDGDGHIISQRRESVAARGTGVAALWQITAPERGPIMLRTRVQAGTAQEAGMDQLIYVDQNESALTARAARLRRSGGVTENVGAVPAYAPGTCLLPGEKCTITQEWVNEQRV